MTKHQELIEALKRSGASTGPFRGDCVRAIDRSVADPREAGIAQIDWQCSVRPDAYKVDELGATVTVFEVEVTSAVTEEKLSKYEDLWWFLDEYHWRLKLVAIDRFGVEREIPLVYKKLASTIGEL
jgi:hypothetical protein